MVGDPKSLHDPKLAQIEAQIRVTCIGCRASELWELPALIEEVKANGGNPDWRAARSAIRCPRRCPSPRITLLPIPFGRRRARRRAHRYAVLNLSLQVLKEAAARSSRKAVGTIDVRLALHVLRPYVRDQALLTAYWTAATADVRHPWRSCHQPYRAIWERLVELGAIVEPRNAP